MRVFSLLFYLKHILTMCFCNKFRFFLSVIGLSVGLFVFTAGNILMDSYYNERCKNYRQMGAGVLALMYEAQYPINKDNISGNYNSTVFEAIVSAEKPVIYAQKYKNDFICTLSANIIGVSNTKELIPAKFTDNEYLITNTNIVKGRYVTQADSIDQRNVVVIDELTEELLFPDGNSLGKQITVNVSIPGFADISMDTERRSDKQQLTVIGIISNSYYGMQEEMKYRKNMSDLSESFDLNTVIYCPESYVSSSFDLSSKRMIAWSELDDFQSAKIRSSLSIYKNLSLQEINSYNIVDTESLMLRTNKELEPLRIFLIFILIILLLISGINAMSIMFFSVKERINEIGVKKALGASKIEIINQFIIEGILTALIASIATIFVSCLTVLLIQKTLVERMFILFEVHFSLSNILLPVLISIIYGFIFSLIPSYYGANIKVTDSLRFE